MASNVSLAGRLAQVVIDLVFPPRCVACAAGGALICAGCQASLRPATRPRCPQCWRPGSDVCFDCRRVPPSFDGLRAGFVYVGTACVLVRALKYRGMTALAKPMGLLLAETVREQGLAVDLVVPVPLSGVRRRTRGYNQAETLASALANELGLPIRASALRRRRHAPPQARSADAEERRRNVAGAFEARQAIVSGRDVLLVDDVTTTSATFAACAGTLKDAGACSVWALAFARED